MNRIDLQAMLHRTNELVKICLESKDCKHGCANCSYYAICHVARALQSLIRHEADKYDAKGELKHDNH